ncbi:hypothetical protein BCIN_02g06000 [Botrytis cinerea B05.10]|uniref:Integral membrane protein n=1 Tax=Botryotinia fuckeliana (strain B05.10) TaxID=332648 RepID=A0A384J9F5_BOTFB|nr:hypothetical protein BCIN_02g06000 [Botrytis cinerea B05.10]ATZ47308.1 hypothetical protein BCIN_02g06000 [Botrytis cinerea B05.10]
MPSHLRNLAIYSSLILLGLAPLIAAHGDEEPEMDMNMPMSSVATAISTATVLAGMDNTVVAEPSSYFRYSEHGSLMVAHIILMTIGWVFVLPICVMLSISRSRLSLPAQFAFLALNGGGLLCSIIYNASTPDLYPNNFHHKLGWFLICVVTAQALLGVISAYAGRRDEKGQENSGYIPVSREAMAEHTRMHERPKPVTRLSDDSGQGTEPNTESIRSRSMSLSGDDENTLNESENDELEKVGLMEGTQVDQYLSKRLAGLLSARLLGIIRLACGVVDRVILLLGFAILTSGFVTYGGLFKGAEVYSGLAHFIKGGVFFWYGILTLGRWAGCFAEIGWSWNIKPHNERRFTPTAEFVESFLIFFYGSTNVFLEHLAAWGSAWSAQDLEHISITIMFIGGGLCGMLIESNKIRNLLNTTVQQSSSQMSSYHPEAQEPKSYRFSMNPIPALVVLLLGMMMSSHHQHSMVSTMIHGQWGTLLVGAAFARAATYVVFYLSPPTSILPGRPPTEIITAFCLMAGGLIFMASSKDTVKAIEMNDLDAMFVFTVSMGLITFLMAWIILVVAIKGWAMRKEKRWGKSIDYEVDGTA